MFEVLQAETMMSADVAQAALSGAKFITKNLSKNLFNMGKRCMWSGLQQGESTRSGAVPPCVQAQWPPSFVMKAAEFGAANLTVAWT